MPELTDYRVLYQYKDHEGNEHYEFTTVLAPSPGAAANSLSTAGYHDQDEDFLVVQVVKANVVATGFVVEPA